MNSESAIFAGGCFWCTEAIFKCDYYEHNKDAAYCEIVIAPKLDKQ